MLCCICIFGMAWVAWWHAMASWHQQKQNKTNLVRRKEHPMRAQNRWVGLAWRDNGNKNKNKTRQGEQNMRKINAWQQRICHVASINLSWHSLRRSMYPPLTCLIVCRVRLARACLPPHCNMPPPSPVNVSCAYTGRPHTRAPPQRRLLPRTAPLYACAMPRLRAHIMRRAAHNVTLATVYAVKH